MNRPNVIGPVCAGVMYSTSRHSLGIYRCVINSCCYTITKARLNGHPLESLIEQALARVILQHGILQVGIIDEDNQSTSFVRLNGVDLRVMIERQKQTNPDSDTRLKQILARNEKQHDMLWDNLANKPAWKIIVHEWQDTDDDKLELNISYAFHHAYGDGKSSQIFHRDLLQALHTADDPPAELSSHYLRLESAPSITPSMDVAVPFRISWRYFLGLLGGQIWENLAPGWLQARLSSEFLYWTGNPINPEPHKANMRLIHIPPHTVTSLLQACRNYGTTLTPLIHALLATSFSARLPASEASAFQTTTPICLRRFARSDIDTADSMSYLVTTHEDTIDANTVSRMRATSASDEALIWDTAVAIGTRLRAKVASLPNDDIVGLMPWVSDWQRFHVRKFGKKREATWEVTNIGSMRAEDVKNAGDAGDGWRIKRSILSQGAMVVGAAVGINVAGVEGEGVWITLTWQESIVEGGVMDNVERGLRDCLDRYGAERTFGGVGGDV